MTDARRIQDALRAMAQAGRELVSVPPFTLTIDPGTDLTFLNYAVPDPGAVTWPDAAIEELCAAFEFRGRVPRLEIVEDCWPGLVPALERHGFALERRMLGLACDAAGLVAAPVPSGVRVVPIRRETDSDLVRGFLDVMGRAFADLGAPATVDDAAVADFRASGAPGVLALAGDEPVGRAAWQDPAMGVTEIVGVGVLPEHRRRGIAAAVTAAAAREAFVAGAQLAFLTPGDEGAARVYARAGFAPSVRCAHLSRPQE